MPTQKEIIEAGACPNCWGVQAYNDQFVDFVKDQTKDNINHNNQNPKAFIQQFVATHVSGIKLKNNACPVCKKVY